GITRLGSFNTNGTTHFFTGPISGTSSFRRSAEWPGTGATTILAATNTYTGTTLVDDGVLLIDGVIGTNSVMVTNLGTLGGNGLVRGPVSVQAGGTLSPGASIGKLTISNSLSLDSGSTCLMEFSKNGSSLTNDSIVGLTTLTYGGALSLANV